ncbi:MAG: WD40/YVTN/BNR-like repeat-containing protein, partial [Longimicrobiales bacterium]
MRANRLGLVLFGLAAVAGPLSAQQSAALDSLVLASLRWRNIGPANMSGRITDVEGIPGPSRTLFVAAAAGGIWKSTNGGTTFRPLFDNERVISMGDLAIAPSDTMQIWAGTGEEDSRNSISPGGGIYKSTDGGRNWRLMGLEKTEAIARIIVHPTNANTVWVAALGAIWRSNAERGLYKTTDGGQTWTLSKFISDKAGFIDIAMHPSNPDVLFAASWERVRGPYFLKSGGPGSALWKTTDGGTTWTEVKGGGFPATEKGRIGLAIAPSNPRVIYALVEAAPPTGQGDGCRAAQAGGCGLYRSQDGGDTWEWMAADNTRPFYYSQVRVDPRDPNRVYWSSTPVKYSNDGGRTAGNTTIGIHVDHHAMWIDPSDGNHIVVGNDGGIGVTWDRGGNWDFVNTMALGQFYNISFDMGMPYRVCGGLQDNGSWCGPSRRGGPITNATWFNVGGGDGFHTAQDPRDQNTIYSESQGGNMGRLNHATNDRVALRKPNWLDNYRMFEDSMFIEQGDPPRTLTAQQQQRLRDLRTRQASDSVSLQLRWNWNTPFFLSPHNPDVFYAGANRVMKSTRRGDDMMPISADLSTRDTMRIRVSSQTTGGVTTDVTGAELHSTIVSLAESPVQRGLLYAGTDDGNLWISPDDGRNWTDLTARFRGVVPAKTYVSRIEPSNFDASTFYVTFDNHREGDFTPYVFSTADGGRTFRSIANNLPKGGPDFVHVIREDPVNRDLLYVGTDVGVYVSLDRGGSWQKLMNGLPTVPVHDLKVHPRDRELIAGTHGR